MKKSFRVHLFLFLANLIYALGFTITKDVVPGFIKPFGAIFIRVSAATLLFILVQFFFVNEKLRRADIPLLIACGFFGVAVNQLLFFKGLAITTPIHGALVMTTTPIMVMILSVLFKDEKMTGRKVAGVLTGVAGALVIIVFGKEISFSASTRLGDTLIMINAISYAVFIVIAKPLMSRYHPVTVIKWTFIFGWFFVLPVGWREFLIIEWNSFQAVIWFELVYIVIATTFFAYLLNIMALREANPSVVGIYIYVQPALATAFAMMMGRDDLTAIKVMASALIFAGVYLVSIKSDNFISPEKKREQNLS